MKYLGVEQYGLIGFYASLQSIFLLLDLGMSSTITQEIAKENESLEKKHRIVNLTFTLECIYWTLSIIAFLVLFLLANFLAKTWFIDSNLSQEKIAYCVQLMSVLLFFRLPLGLYIGAMTGLQHQSILNYFSLTVELLKFISILLSFIYFNGDIVSFLIIQICFSILLIFGLRIFVWMKINMLKLKAMWSYFLLQDVRKFSLGVAGITIASIILTQADKFILVNFISLKDFGYYTLAFSIASIPSKIVGTIATVFYPKLVKQFSINNLKELSRVYHEGCQFISILIIPISIIVIFFTPEILNLWFLDIHLVHELVFLVRIFIIGFLFNGFMTMPYYLQLSIQWTKLSFYKNMVAFVLLVPLVYWLAIHYGIYGAAWFWLILNLLYIFIEIPIMHKVILPLEMKVWYWEDILLPIILVLSLDIIFYKLLNYSIISNIIIIASICLLVLFQIYFLNAILRHKPINNFLSNNSLYES
ncbi:MAG: oligosaccharide flippase family protein [Saprospiraceae bacterium]|nr:oligosaccharide flippase family protein [Candidatus Defluviibacterium haderslevense]MBK7244009.1 oligosaccharide flippase family protein [Candidatus Defluviibacterium haderslevense]